MVIVHVNMQDGCCVNDTCKYRFPFKSHEDQACTMDQKSGIYTYYRPGEEHRNVVPYHPVSIAFTMSLSVICQILKHCTPKPVFFLRADPVAAVGCPHEHSACDRPGLVKIHPQVRPEGTSNLTCKAKHRIMV